MTDSKVKKTSNAQSHQVEDTGGSGSASGLDIPTGSTVDPRFRDRITEGQETPKQTRNRP